MLHRTNHGVKDSNFESKIPSGFYGPFTKTRSQKYIYIVIVVHRDQTSKKQKEPKPSRLCFAFEKPFPIAFDLKNFKVFFALLEEESLKFSYAFGEREFERVSKTFSVVCPVECCSSLSV